MDRRPNYVDVSEQDLLSLANRKGLVQVAALLRERGCLSQVKAPAVAELVPVADLVPVSKSKHRSGCNIM